MPTPQPPAPPAAAESRDQRRNVLFSSTRRPRDNPKPSEAAAQMEPSTSTADLRFSLPPAPAIDEPRPPTLRREPPMRTIRPISTVGPRDSVSAPPLPPAPSAPVPPPAPPPPVQAADPAAAPSHPLPADRPARDGDPAVTVLKSGVVDGMAYWLFSDGSIEAQMPEGMMRFSSIDELRAHLDKRP